MSEIDYRPQQSNILYWRNVANEGRGSQMTQCLHEACDYAAKLEAENAELREGVLRVAQLVEGLKLPCSMDPESPQAIRNGTYQSIALIARALLARVEGK